MPTKKLSNHKWTRKDRRVKLFHHSYVFFLSTFLDARDSSVDAGQREWDGAHGYRPPYWGAGTRDGTLPKPPHGWPRGEAGLHQPGWEWVKSEEHPRVGLAVRYWTWTAVGLGFGTDTASRFSFDSQAKDLVQSNLILSEWSVTYCVAVFHTWRDVYSKYISL